MDDLPPPPPYTPYPTTRDSTPSTNSLGLPPTDNSLSQPNSQTNLGDNSDEILLHISGAAYFELRPPPFHQSPNVHIHRLSIPSDVDFTTLPFPRPAQTWLDGDVNDQDWATFLNHLIPICGSPRVVQTPKGYPIPRKLDGSQRQIAGKKLDAVIQEWNENFFLPRGLQVHREFPKQILTINDAQFFPAILRGDKSTARYLLDDRVNINTKNEEGATALDKAIQKRDIAMIKMLIKYGADVETAIDGYTPLYVAVSKGEYAITETLLERPINLDARTPTGETPLYKAVSIGNFKIAQLLIANSADVSARPAGGDSMLYLATSKRHFPLVELLLEKGAEVEARMVSQAAARGDYVSCVLLKSLLSKRSVDVNVKGADGKSPLAQAVSEGNQSIAKVLLENGAVIEKSMVSGANARKDWAMSRLLIKSSQGLENLI